jgi:pyruvate dehydrogenase E2 component (dihydrolipoamide acetyltransferase)
MAKKEYRFTGRHAQDLPSGRVVAPGEVVKLDDADVAFLGTENIILLEDTRDAEATDAAVKLARKEGVNLSAVSGTGKDGTITVEDVQAAADAAKEEREEE